MRNLPSSQATVYTIAIFLLTMAISFWFPGYSITIGGLLLGIFFTTFIPEKKSTLIAGIVSILVVFLFIIVHQEPLDSAKPITHLAFKLLLIFFTALVVTHIKNLYQNIGFDKNHMTSLFENATEGIILTNKIGKIVLV
ncbi:MAG: hypothetical protein ACXWCZ_08610, partial [Flavisolibacter sp.]